MQKLQPDSSQEKGNGDEKPGAREDLPLGASQNRTMTTRKKTWPLRWPILIAGALVLLAAVVVARLLLQVPRSQPVPGVSSHEVPLSTLTPTPILNVGPGVTDHSVHPTVVEGIAYVSTLDSVTYALDASNGTLLWRSTTTKGAAYSPPLVANGIVYVNTNLGEAASAIYALRASDGKMLWSQQGDNTLYLDQVVNGILYEASDGGITAVRASDGSKLWNYTAKSMDFLSVYWIGFVKNGVVYGSASPYMNSPSTGNMMIVYALSERDGSVLWSQTGSFLAENQGVIYTATNNTLCAVQASDGSKDWCRVIGPQNTSLQTLAGPAVFDGILYLFTTTFNPTTAFDGIPGTGQAALTSTLRPLVAASPLAPRQVLMIAARSMRPQKEGKPSVYALRVEDGTILWSRLLNDGKNGWISGFGIENGVLYAGVNDEASSGGQVYALQGQTGKELWRTTSVSPPTYGILAAGMLFISSDSGEVDALNLRDGSRLWHQGITGEIRYQPVLAGDTFFAGDSTGLLYAFDIYNGAIRWQYPAK